jgi:hypothetical protein
MIAISFVFEDEADKLYKSVTQVLDDWRAKKLQRSQRVAPSLVSTLNSSPVLPLRNNPFMKKTNSKFQKLTKDLIGSPIDFQHISNMGNRLNIEKCIEIQKLPQNNAPLHEKAKPRRAPPKPPILNKSLTVKPVVSRTMFLKQVNT